MTSGLHVDVVSKNSIASGSRCPVGEPAEKYASGVMRTVNLLATKSTLGAIAAPLTNLKRMK